MTSPDPFDRLERQLRGAVRAQAARPSLAARLRGRLRLPVLLSAAALGAAGTGALAASGVLLPEGPPLEEELRAPTPREGAGVVEGDARVLALRVADPSGGLPWGMRVFRSSRGLSCVQVGQVQNGRLGRVSAAGAGPERFRPLQALPGTNSLCSGVSRGEFPVIRGLRRVELRGGLSDRRRCDGGPCPVTAVRVLRFGLLGPAAREARFVESGRVRARQELSPVQGGAYLFVQPADPRPFQAAADEQERFAKRFSAEMRQLRAQGATAERALRVALQRAQRYTPRGITDKRAAQARRSRGEDAITARFDDGTVVRVAGRGRSAGPLPGVTTSPGSRAKVRAPLEVTVRGRGATRRFDIRFRAPVAVTRADRGYSLTATGPDGRRCTRQIPGGGQATTRDIARGEPVTFEDVGVRKNTGWGRRTWCPGRIVLRVGYRTPGSGFRGSLVGSYVFTVSR